jgi:hypothetical protein
MLKIKKKLTLNKEKLRVLTSADLNRVNGGIPYGDDQSCWCSTENNEMKCGTNLNTPMIRAR